MIQSLEHYFEENQNFVPAGPTCIIIIYYVYTKCMFILQCFLFTVSTTKLVISNEHNRFDSLLVGFKKFIDEVIFFFTYTQYLLAAIYIYSRIYGQRGGGVQPIGTSE